MGGEAKVTVHPAAAAAGASAPASEQVKREANQEVMVEDARKRIIVLKKPSMLAQYRIIDILGESASNPTYVGMVMPLIFVASIDGDPVRMPNTRKEIDVLIERLGEEGVAAAMIGIQEHFTESRDAGADKAALKK